MPHTGTCTTREPAMMLKVPRLSAKTTASEIWEVVGHWVIGWIVEQFVDLGGRAILTDIPSPLNIRDRMLTLMCHLSHSVSLRLFNLCPPCLLRMCNLCPRLSLRMVHLRPPFQLETKSAPPSHLKQDPILRSKKMFWNFLCCTRKWKL